MADVKEIKSRLMATADSLETDGNPLKAIKSLTAIIHELRGMTQHEIFSQQGFINKIDQIVDENLSDPDFTVDMIANELLISRSLLYKRFAEYKGGGLNAYITRKRIDVAKSLLNNVDTTVAEVAYAVGFINQRYFSTVFRHHVGMTPTQWRERLFML